LSVRYGKAMSGGPPRRRNVLTVFEWAVEVIEQYLERRSARSTAARSIRRCG
jgi:hypothetical protein